MGKRLYDRKLNKILTKNVIHGGLIILWIKSWFYAKIVELSNTLLLLSSCQKINSKKESNQS